MTTNMITIDGYKAVVMFDPDLGMLRGEFVGLNGAADFYAGSVDNLKEEGRASLKVFLDMCSERGIEPLRTFSGRFNIRIDAKLHEAAVLAAKAGNKSLNDWVVDAISEAAKAA